MIENLQAQIRERKAVDFILQHATFRDVPRQEVVDEDALDQRLDVEHVARLAVVRREGRGQALRAGEGGDERQDRERGQALSANGSKHY